MIRQIKLRLRMIQLSFIAVNQLAKVFQDARRYQVLRTSGICTDPITLVPTLKVGKRYFKAPGVVREKVVIQGKGAHLDTQIDDVIEAQKDFHQ